MLETPQDPRIKELESLLREIWDMAREVPEGEGRWVWTGDGLAIRIEEALRGV